MGRWLLLIVVVGVAAAVVNAYRNRPVPIDQGVVSAEQRREQVGVVLRMNELLDLCGGKSLEGRRADVDRQFKTLAEAGIRWARVAINWEQLEPRPDAWNWEPADLVVETARRHGVKLLWIIGNTAPWDSDNGKWNGVPRDLDNPDGRFSQYVGKLVERYREDIHHWEIRDQPNTDHMFAGTNSQQYAAYLERAAEAIRRVEPDAVIVFGGLGDSLVKQLKWFSEVVADLKSRRATMPFDAANFHIYAGDASGPSQGSRSMVESYLHQCCEQISVTLKSLQLAEMPVWISEFNYPADSHEQPDPAFNGLEGQARVACELFTQQVKHDRRMKIFWSSLLDDQSTGPDTGGLIRSNANQEFLEQRPAFDALKQVLVE